LKRLGTAVVGLGIGAMHVQAYATLPESDLVAVCDANPERLHATADQYGVAAYTSIGELLSDDRVAVVSIATPHPSHAPLAIQQERHDVHTNLIGQRVEQLSGSVGVHCSD